MKEQQQRRRQRHFLSSKCFLTSRQKTFMPSHQWIVLVGAATTILCVTGMFPCFTTESFLLSSPSSSSNPAIDAQRRTTTTKQRNFHVNDRISFFVPSRSTVKRKTVTTTVRMATTTSEPFQDAVSTLETVTKTVESTLFKTCKVRPSPTSSHRIGLVATQAVSKGEVLLALPYSSPVALTPELAKSTFAGLLPDAYNGWTGDAGLIALLLLNELALASDTENAGLQLTTKQQQQQKRTSEVNEFFRAWIATLPRVDEMAHLHPLFWSEDDQEILQASSSTKIYRALDDVEEDGTWLEEYLFSKHRNHDPTKEAPYFPETVTFQDDDVEYPCFSARGFAWAYALVQSRSFFLDGSLRLLPLLDLVNHSDDVEQEIQGTYMGTFGTVQGAQLVANRSYKAGEEVFCSYGPKSAIDYLLEHGFVPKQCWRVPTSEITLELDKDDRFYDDKLDILEFETYDAAPMDPVQSFDLVARNNGQPDPALIQFARLCQLGSTDAFLLESIFRKEVWDFMSYPVSEQNELAVVNSLTEICQRSLDEFAECDKTMATSSNDENSNNQNVEICNRIRESERSVLEKTIAFLQREKEALDLKEYYQERRLKDLGLDSEWSMEDELGIGGDDDLAFGQKRAPGGADYDW